MKSVARPNKRLRHERELRGWSQAKVAEALGTDLTSIGRWERGLIIPSPHFREKLCILFQKNASELGLLEGDDTEKETLATLSSETVLEKATPALLTRINDPTLPFLSANGLVGREYLIQTILSSLADRKRVTPITLVGLPGVGKTALSIHVAHCQEVRMKFPDGVLWAALGPQPDLLAHLSRWGALLGLQTVEMEALATVEEWAQAIRRIIGTRHILLVLDDVWELDTALVMLTGGLNCAYLITTRFPTIALHLSGQEAITVHEINDHDGLELLASFVPKLVAEDPQTAQTLVTSVGALPLALTIIGSYLRVQEQTGQPRRMSTSIQLLSNVEQRLRLSLPSPQRDRPPSLSTDVAWSLQSVIAASEQYLDTQARSAFYTLSIFPAKPASFSEDDVRAMDIHALEVLDRLMDIGLLESYGPGRYALHKTVADYGRIQQEMMPEPKTDADVTEWNAQEIDMTTVVNKVALPEERPVNVEKEVRAIPSLQPLLSSFVIEESFLRLPQFSTLFKHIHWRERNFQGSLLLLFCCGIPIALLFNMYDRISQSLGGFFSPVPFGDDIVQTLGWLLGMLFCFSRISRLQHATVFLKSLSEVKIAQKRVCVWITLTFLVNFISRCVYMYLAAYHIPHSYLWSHSVMLAQYPCLLMVILALPARPFSTTTRIRVVLDGVLILTTLIMCSWYVLLGPIMLQGNAWMFTKLVSTAYPCGDLVLFICLLLLFAHIDEPSLRSTRWLLLFGLLSIIIADSFNEYDIVQGVNTLDLWANLIVAMGYLFIAIAAQSVRFGSNYQFISASWKEETPIVGPTHLPSQWQTLLVFAFIPAALLFMGWVWFTEANSPLAQGVYISGLLLIIQVVIRQMFVILETFFYKQELSNVH